MRTGQGSWNWGITRESKHPEAAMAFLEFLLQTDQVLAMANANGAVPGTRAAISRSELYGPGRPLRLFVEQLREGFAVPRPRTPAYPIISSAFERAFRRIRNGADVKKALDEAAAVIDQDIQDNQGYPDVTELDGANQVAR
jgi:multiple sugar transport system substrate-binding protein